MTPRPWRMAISIQAFALQGGYAGVRVMFGYKALEFGNDALFLGLMATTFALPGLLAAVPIGHLLSRFSANAVTAIGSSVFATGIVLAVGAPTRLVLAIASVLAGLGHIAASIAQQTLVAQRTPPGRSDNDFGILATAASAGQLVGPPLIAGVAVLAATLGVSVADQNAVGLLATLVWVIGAIIPSWHLRLPRGESSRPSSERAESLMQGFSLARKPGVWRALVVSAAVLVTMDITYAFVPAWAQANGIGIGIVGWLFAVRAAVSVASRVGLGWSVVRLGRKLLLVLALSAGAVAMILLPFADTVGAFFAMAALGLTLGLPQPLTMSWIVALVRPRQVGAAMGLRMGSNRLAQVTIPLVIGATSGGGAVASVFWLTAGFLAAAVAISAGSDPDQKRT
ncbi:MFS transporter [Microbacterium ulmi]|uniref:MFS transporter n=1 Tax=Microbacterium ulmi TaxID=179095 RepID=A0A7Y2LYP0_9MICO|nr:MFS transporter [Microbacterium ulmi]NII69828.1 putative MFS family arabinose efflux permease [Microbacterium ulmi]NNH03202.1 MFS transporter [Microbacterium ulmi]